jgi:hypothetical protein
MMTYVEFTYPKLVGCWKLAIIKEFLVAAASHIQQSKKKRSRPSGCVITSYLGTINPYKKSNEAK